jgi:DNA-binding transcriptional LysR family regulator
MLEWLKTFVTVYQTLNFSVAARQLSITQPTVSFQIKSLEEQLNVTLFIRNGRKEMRTTKEADFLYPRMVQAIDSLNDSFTQVLEKKNRIESCTIASSHTATHYLLPEIIESLLESFPKVNFTFREMNSEAVMQGIANDEVQLGFLEKPISMENISKEIIYEDKLMIAGNPAAKYWILREKDSGMRFFNEIYLKEKDIHNAIIETNSETVTKKLLSTGYGRAIVSSLAQGEHQLAGLESYKTKRYLYLAKNKNKTTPYLEAIYTKVKEEMVLFRAHHASL